MTLTNIIILYNASLIMNEHSNVQKYIYLNVHKQIQQINNACIKTLFWKLQKNVTSVSHKTEED